MQPEELNARLERIERQGQLVEDHFNRAFWGLLDKVYEQSLPVRDATCVVCGLTGKRGDYEVLLDQCMFGGGRLERYKCPACDCIFGPQKYLDLDDEFVASDYRFLYSRYAEGDSRASEARTFQSLDPGKEKLYLDWGCGGAWNDTIEVLRNDGWDVWGYEPSADKATDYVVNRRQSISAKFDGIFSNNVIEHFRDPVGQFRDFHQILKPGGLMAHSSPCYDYAYANTRFHSVFLLGKSPWVLADRTGFRVVDQVRDGEYINTVFSLI